MSLKNFWFRLCQIKQVTIQTQSGNEAFGEVKIEKEKNVLLFLETGKWKDLLLNGVEFKNALRWSFDYKKERVTLEHLRYGSNHPVFLFLMAPTSDTTLQSEAAHLCGHDSYFGQIEFSDKFVALTWTISGPRKNETLRSIYF